MPRIFVTGDTHGIFTRVADFCAQQETTNDDILIILGDAGINYFADWRDERLKLSLIGLPITLFCVHGNHEIRPENITTYGLKGFADSVCYFEPEFPNINFAIDGSVYRFGDKRCLVIGGAYSADKWYRLQTGKRWFDDEQPSEETKQFVENVVSARRSEITTVLSHTCPFKYIPIEMFLPYIDQSTVDDSTERWFDTIEEKLDYERWYCGHYHTDKAIDKMRFMFNDFELLTTI